MLYGVTFKVSYFTKLEEQTSSVVIGHRLSCGHFKPQDSFCYVYTDMCMHVCIYVYTVEKNIQ